MQLTVAAIVRMEVLCGAGERTNVPVGECGRGEIERDGRNSIEMEEVVDLERGSRARSKVRGAEDTWSRERVKEAVVAASSPGSASPSWAESSFDWYASSI
jgi:hypothetical protein